VLKIGWMIAAAVALTGCATVWSRGIVQDARGESLPNAMARVVDKKGDNPVATTLTNFNGCFMLGPFVAPQSRDFELEIGAPGYKTATFAFDLQTPILFVRLLPDSSEAASDIHPATYSERTGKYEPLCVPPLPPGAEQLSP
jgi:hypothetical protein